MVRAFRVETGKEPWDIGDGSAEVEVRGDGHAVPPAKDGYAEPVHRFATAGRYLVRVERTESNGGAAVAHVHVRVGQG